jgi:hypothetical protein
MNTQELTSAHIYIHLSANGDAIDAEYFCSDWCHRSWCNDNGVAYEGWNGCHEVQAPQFCSGCTEQI